MVPVARSTRTRLSSSQEMVEVPVLFMTLSPDFISPVLVQVPTHEFSMSSSAGRAGGCIADMSICIFFFSLQPIKPSQQQLMHVTSEIRRAIKNVLSKKKTLDP